jgi:Carboxypeptidase regulatory-like domain
MVRSLLMPNSMNTRRTFPWILLALVSFTACGDNIGGKHPDQPDAGPTAERFYGRVLDSFGPVSGATVTINGKCVTTNGKCVTTDDGGRFDIAVAPGDRYIINVRRHGYVPVSKIHRGRGLADLELELTPAQVIVIDPTQPVDVSDDRGTRIVLAPNALVDADDNPVTGPVQLHIHTYDLSKEEMVGDMEATDADDNRVVLQSVGVFSADFTDETGKPYKLAKNQTANISMILPPENTFTGPIPLWYYNMDQGRWIEDGEGMVQNGVATGTVSHFTAWNFDYKITPACIRVEVAPELVATTGGHLDMRAELSSPWGPMSYELWLESGDNVLYNLPPNIMVKIYVPSTADSPMYEVNTGVPWGSYGPPPAPYTECNGHVSIGTAKGAISGTVQRGGRRVHFGVTIKAWDGTAEVAETTSDESGAYTLNLPAGTYKFTLERQGYLSVEDSVMVSSGRSTRLDCVRLPAGNFVIDPGAQKIDSADVNFWTRRLSTPLDGPDDPRDINGDGRIDSIDQTLLTQNEKLKLVVPLSPAQRRCLPDDEPVCDGAAECPGTAVWSLGFGGPHGWYEAESIAVDAAGNVLITGFFIDTADFGGGPLYGEDAFVAKLDAGGNHLWSRSLDVTITQGQYGHYSGSVATDAAGNVLVAGGFDEGYGSFSDIFVIKLDADGDPVWRRSFANDLRELLYVSMSADAAGNVLVTGTFEGTVDFGGGPLTSAGSLNIFVAKLDAGGNHLWSRRFGEAAIFQSSAVDAQGNVLVTGHFVGTMDFGGGPLTTIGSSGDVFGDVFVAKLDADGNHLWSRRFGDERMEQAYSIAADATGNVLITGIFDSMVDFGGGPLTNGGIFVAKLDAGGNHLWSRRVNNTFPHNMSISDDAAGNVLLTGSFLGTVDFGGGPLTNIDMYNRDIFVAKLDAGGSHLWSRRFGDELEQNANSIVVDAAGNVLVTGRFDGTVDFGNGRLTTDEMGMFVVKLAP